MERYEKMPLEELEVAISELNDERMEIAEAIRTGAISEDYGKRKYKKVDKKHGQLSILFEKRLANQYDTFIGMLSQ